MSCTMAMVIHLLGCKPSEEYPPEVFALKGEELYIGRLPSCVITMNDDSISRLHARIYRENGEWWIEDIRSRNGIFINGRSVTNGKLIEGDIITTGDVHFTMNHRRVDQIDHMKDWVEARVQDAIEYRDEILKLKSQRLSFEHSGVIPSAPDQHEYAEPAAEMTQPPVPQTPVTHAPFQPNPRAQMPNASPQFQPQTPSFSPNPTGSPNRDRRPVAPNVMGNDTTIVAIIAVTVVLLIVGLVWKFKDYFMPASSF